MAKSDVSLLGHGTIGSSGGPYFSTVFANFVTVSTNYSAIPAFLSSYLVHWFTKWLMAF